MSMDYLLRSHVNCAMVIVTDYVIIPFVFVQFLFDADGKHFFRMDFLE